MMTCHENRHKYAWNWYDLQLLKYEISLIQVQGPKQDGSKKNLQTGHLLTLGFRTSFVKITKRKAIL